MSLEKFHLPDKLDLTASKELLAQAGSSAAFVAKYEEETRISLQYLKRIFSKYKDHQNREQAVRQFLQARNCIAGNYSFFSYPNSPINQLCLQLMQEIVKPDEPLIKIMVPTLATRAHYIEDDLITLTETKDTSGKRTLKPHTVIISDDGKGVIPIAQWFSYQEEYMKHGDEPFHHLYSDDSKLVHLNEHEIKRLRYCVMPFSDKFFDDADLRKRLLKSKGTLAEAISNLCDDMFENSKAKKGTAEQAHDDVFDCIRKFSLILDSIDPEVKEQVLSQKASAQHFGFYWNIISAYDGKERKQYAINDTETCIWDNGSYLKSILKSNINFFSNIQIAQKKDEASSSSSATVTTSSQNLLKNIEEELAKRRKGEHPQDAIYFYEKVDVALISSFLDEYKEHLNNDCMVTRIQSYESALFYQKLLDEQAFIDVLKKTPRNILSLLLKTAGNTKNDRLIVAIIKAGYDFPKIITTDQAAWFSLLSAAIENRWINVCKAILEKPEIKLTATSAIHMAAKHGLTEIVEIIANKIINFDYKDDSNNNYTPLQYAAQYGHLDTVKFLVSKGAKINIDYISMHHQPVFLAAVKAHFAIAWFFIQNGAHFSLHPYGLTLMHFAAYHGNVDFAEQLCGINVGLHDFNEADQTPIFCAVLKHHLNMVKFFIKYGVSVNDTYSKKTPSLLLLAAYNNDTNIIKVLLQAGAHINIAGDVNYMPLHYCAARGNLEVTQLFVEHHADLYAISSNGYTPLDLALKYNMIAVSEFLMSKMDFEVLSNMIPHRNKKYFKDNALFLAASKCPPRILEALINKGLNPAAVNVQKETAFHSAVASNNIDGLIFLIQNAVNKPADYEIKDSKGNTPLARAIINGLPLCVEALLKAGAQLPEKIDNIPLSEFIQKKLAEPNANQTIWTRLKMIIANKESAGVSFDALMLSCQTGREVQIDEEETDDHTQIASAQGTLNLAN